MEFFITGILLLVGLVLYLVAKLNEKFERIQKSLKEASEERQIILELNKEIIQELKKIS